jgi:hypothetical protein
MLHALKYPDRYAAAYTILPQFLDDQVPQTAVGANLPPITTYWGFRDSGPFGIKGNVPFLKRMNECNHAVWSRWGDHGHADPTGFDRDTMIPGGVFRFKRNELLPVFLNTSTDDNCGQRGAENVKPAGSVNTGIDWASGLHSLKLDGEALADKEDELAVTFRAGQDCTTDLAFRRVQHFKPAAKMVLSYKNIAVADGKLLQEGDVTVPEDLIWVLKGIQMTKAGNRVAVRVSAK